MHNEYDPIESSIAWLCEHGFEEKEAKNIFNALRADSPEQLWEDYPKWLEWCGKLKQEYEGIVMMAAKGVMNVHWNDDINQLKLSLSVSEIP